MESEKSVDLIDVLNEIEQRARRAAETIEKTKRDVTGPVYDLFDQLSALHRGEIQAVDIIRNLIARTIDA